MYNYDVLLNTSIIYTFDKYYKKTTNIPLNILINTKCINKMCNIF